jgi:hypothetical protein
MEELEKDIIFYLEQFLNTQLNEFYSYSISNDDFIEVYATGKPDESRKYCLIKVGISQSSEEIYIPHICIPADMKHKGIGKKMIYVVYTVGKKYDYDVFLVQLDDAFKEKLLKRDALETDDPDTLQITERTNLF